MDKILIIDSSMFSRKMLSIFLKNEYEILSANNEAVGMQLAKIHIPSLILLDIELTDINNFETLKALKSNAATRGIPVIMMAGALQPKTEEKAYFLGAADFVRKPFREAVVRARVRTHVNIFSYQKIIESQLLMDPITRMPNRESANLILCAKWDDENKSNQSLSIAMMGIDSLNQVYQTYGLQQTERILTRVAEAAQKIVKTHDGYMARYEEDKFIMTLGSIDEYAAENIAESIREMVQSVLSTDLPDANVTVSIGGNTILPQSGEGFGECINAAEKMLRAAKENGRNCVMWNNKIPPDQV